MKKVVALIFGFMLLLQISFAGDVTYKAYLIGKNTQRIIVTSPSLKSGYGIEITSASKKDMKTLNIFYRIDKGVTDKNSIEFDTRLMAYPYKIILINIDTPNDPMFSDISNLKDADYIKHLASASIINGYSDNTFRPNNNITRAEFMKIILLGKNINIEANIKNDYKDIDKHWAKNIVLTASKSGYINGFSDKTIKPNDNITFGQACKIIDIAFALKTINTSDLPNSNNHWASGFAKKLLGYGIIQNTDEIYKNFNLDKPLTREQCAMLISRALTSAQ